MTDDVAKSNLDRGRQIGMRARLAAAGRAFARSPATAPLLLIGLFTAHYADVLFGEMVISYRDMLFVYLPTRMHFANRLLSGEFPEWYPFDGLGSSYVGNVVTAILHPSTWLHLVLPHYLALNLSVVLAHLAAALGAFQLLRHWNCGRTAALIGGVAYSCSGYLMSMDGNLPYLLSASTIPWAVLGIERLSIPLCSASMALMALSGDPQALYFTSFFLLACAITRHAPANTSPTNAARDQPSLKAFFFEPERRKALAVLTISGIAALLAGAAQLLPALLATPARDIGEEALRSNRFWSLNPLRLLELFTPGFLRLSQGETPVHLYSQEGTSSFWADSLYLSTGILVLALLAIRSRRQARERNLLAISATLSIAIALGSGPNAPIYEFLQHAIPGFSFLRYPEKTLVFVAFATAMLAGLGVETLLQARLDTPMRLFRRTLLFCAIFFFFLCAALPSMENFLLILAGPVGDLDKARDELRQLLPALQTNILIGALFAFLSFTLTLAIRRTKLSLMKFLLLVCALAPFTMVSNQFRIYRKEPSRIFLPPKSIDSPDQRTGIPQYGKARIYAEEIYDEKTIWENISKKIKNKGIIFLNRGANAYFQIESIAGYLPLTAEGRSKSAIKYLPDLVWLFGFNVSFAQKYIPKPNVTDIEDALVLVQDSRAGDRIRLVQGIPAASTEEAIAIANAQDFDAVKAVPVETSDPHFPTQAPLNSKLDVRTYSPELIEVCATSDTPTTLFIADAFAPGWSATIDGLSAPIYPGLIAGRAIALPPGTHDIRLTYQTPGLRTGLILSGIGWLSIGALALRSWRRRAV